ncbi:hypothetical protein C8R43DRAFT_1135338 [Mycena crocata]|nr:hypothetical protein C8R43DRAFT_1135338 [Mycena crocata]
MAEYEVETVMEARVAKKSKKVIWEYNVKATLRAIIRNWEPVASFVGSEDILKSFWERVDVGGRDIKNLTQFTVGDTFKPVGPPRRKPTRRSTKADAAEPTPSASAGPSKEATKSSKRRRSSPPAADPEEKPAKRTRGRVSESPVTRSTEEPRAPREPARRPPAKATTSSARSVRRAKKRTPSPEFVPASEDEEEDVAMLVDPPHPQESPVEPPSQFVVDLSPQDDAPNESTAEPMENQTPPSSTLPSHRARAANPLVKMVDDFSSMEGAISVKARMQGRNGASTETPDASPSSSPTRKSARKPGPGRSSAGMVNKNTSSLLTFDKGNLKTVKGKFTAPRNNEDKAEGSSGLSGISVPDMAVASVPPTSEELLALGGFDSKAAESLDDFEEDVPASVEVPEPTNNAIQQSLTLAKNKLFPPGVAMATTFSNTVTSVWRRATIFGPLGLGSDTVAETPSDSKPFVLKLDALVAVPLELTDATQSLDTMICDKPSGPPGKFFSNVNGFKLLDTVRTGGPSGRVIIKDSATEEHKAHFTRFRSRLDQGELVLDPSLSSSLASLTPVPQFTAMVGSDFLAFCSSESPLIQRLNLPANLIAFADSIFVTQVDIENFTAYAEVAGTADTSRW